MSDKEEREVRPWDMLNPKQPRSTKELQQERLAICYECPFLNQLMVACTKCGCLMNMKTKLANATCPVGKW